MHHQIVSFLRRWGIALVAIALLAGFVIQTSSTASAHPATPSQPFDVREDCNTNIPYPATWCIAPTVIVDPICTGNQWFTGNDLDGYLIGWTRAVDRQVNTGCVYVLWDISKVDYKKCDAYVYIPVGNATATIRYNLWNTTSYPEFGGGGTLIETIDQNKHSNFVQLASFRQAAQRNSDTTYTQIEMTDWDARPGGWDMGWGLDSRYSLMLKCDT